MQKPFCFNHHSFRTVELLVWRRISNLILDSLVHRNSKLNSFFLVFKNNYKFYILRLLRNGYYTGVLSYMISVH